MSLIPVAWPISESESLVIGSLLQANDIPYFVHGAGMASVLPGLQISSYNTRMVMVPASLADQATKVLAHLVPSPDESDSSDSVPSSILGKARLVLEALFFGWFVPRSNKRRAQSEQDGT